MGTEPQQARWPAHLPAGALRVVRWSARYEETVTFYRDTIGLPVLETFHESYGLDGTILGLPGGQVHLEIVRAAQALYPGGGLDQLVFYLPDAAVRERVRRGSPPRVPVRFPRSTTGRPTAVSPTRTPTGEKWCSRPGSISRQDPDRERARTARGAQTRVAGGWLPDDVASVDEEVDAGHECRGAAEQEDDGTYHVLWLGVPA